MGQSSSPDELTVRHQFDCVCKKALKSELLDYRKVVGRHQKYEILMSELSDQEMQELFTMDEYSTDKYRFRVLGYDIEVRDDLIAEALQKLSEQKRNVILLSFFMDMSDAEIAREMKLVRSTIHEHRKRSLEILKRKMKGCTDEEQ